jgi:hypothetical protein
MYILGYFYENTKDDSDPDSDPRWVGFQRSQRGFGLEITSVFVYLKQILFTYGFPFHFIFI